MTDLATHQKDALQIMKLVNEQADAIETLTREKAALEVDRNKWRLQAQYTLDVSHSYKEQAEAAESALREALDNEREACAKIADEYAAPNRFSVHDCWKENQSPSQVYDTAAVDVGGWIANEIRARAFIEKHAPAATSEDK